MRRSLFLFAVAAFFAGGVALVGGHDPNRLQATNSAQAASPAYLGFDRNQYPGDATLGLLRQTFSFSGYWLNPPPGETSNTWQGKRGILSSSGFGFLVLFNGRLDRQLKSVPNAANLGMRDAAAAVNAANKEQFPVGTIIFLDQEEGGRMLPEQRAYVYAWSDAVNAAGYRAGVYCSGIASRESAGVTIITASDLRDNAGQRKIVFFVYNDACPPSNGCAFPRNPPVPQGSGVPFATVWQFAQSPRRREITRNCAFKYDADGNCYAPSIARADGVFVDVDSADSPDPSSEQR
jgi:hypothetical protein